MAQFDTEITRLYNEENLGAREIAKRLNLKHHATVSKRLIKLGLRRNSTTISERGNNKIQFDFISDNLDEAAQSYFEWLCNMSNYRFARVSPKEPYDLLADFGSGWKKIQVKSSSQTENSGSHIFSICKTKINTTGAEKVLYTKDEVDYFFLFSNDIRCWLIPFEDTHGQTRISAEIKWANYEVGTSDRSRTCNSLSESGT